MEAGKSIPLVKVWDLEGFGGVPILADLTGGEKKDLLNLQTSGMYWNWLNTPMSRNHPWSPVFIGGGHYLLTAYSCEGKRLWQTGKPWSEKQPYWTHSAERQIAFADLNGDGRRELISLRRQEIVVVDPHTGEILREAELPEENIEILIAGKTGTAPGEWTIFIGVSNQGREGRMGNPGFFLDPDLRVIEERDYYGAGHAPRALDVDGDGLDEFLIGYECIDQDLEVMWVFPAFEDLEDKESIEYHADAMDIGRFEENGPLLVAYAASNRQYVVDMEGKQVWMRERTHPQQCYFGRFQASGGENQLFVLNKRAELDLFDAQGEIIWSFTPEENWPRGKPKPFAEGHQFHLFDPSLGLRNAGPEGTDLILYLETGWPYIIDGNGNRYADLEHTDGILQDYPWKEFRPDDQGYGFLGALEEREESIRIVLSDRRYAFEYEIPRAGGVNA